MPRYLPQFKREKKTAAKGKADSKHSAQDKGGGWAHLEGGRPCEDLGGEALGDTHTIPVGDIVVGNAAVTNLVVLKVIYNTVLQLARLASGKAEDIPRRELGIHEAPSFHQSSRDHQVLDYILPRTVDQGRLVEERRVQLQGRQI